MRDKTLRKNRNAENEIFVQNKQEKANSGKNNSEASQFPSNGAMCALYIQEKDLKKEIGASDGEFNKLVDP